MTFIVKYLRLIGIGCLVYIIACSESEDRPSETDYKPVARVEKDSLVILSIGAIPDSISIESISKDTSLYVSIDDKSAIFTIPDTSLIKEIIEDKGDDEFYSESDRNFFVQNQAAQFLEQQHVKVIFPMKRYVIFKGNSKLYFLDTQFDKNNPWLAIYFNPDTIPVFFDPNNVKIEWERLDQVNAINQ